MRNREEAYFPVTLLYFYRREYRTKIFTFQQLLIYAEKVAQLDGKNNLFYRAEIPLVKRKGEDLWDGFTSVHSTILFFRPDEDERLVVKGTTYLDLKFSPRFLFMEVL